MNILIKLKSIISHYTTSEEISIKGRLFNLIVGIAAIFILINSLTSPDSNIILAVLFFLSIALIFGANKTGKYQLFSIIFISVCSFFLFPLLYVTNEGISGGMAVYMVFGAAIINLLLMGKARIILFSLYLASTAGLIVMDYWDKQNGLNIIRTFETDLIRYYDVAMAIILCSIGFGLLINFQNKIYNHEREKAEAASKTKTEFLSNVSHEMRTPLNAITGMATIGIKSEHIDRKDYTLNKIADASKHLLGIINDVLDMSKIEAEMMELSPIRFNFREMLNKAAVVTNFRMDEKRQRFSMNLDEDIPLYLVGDDQRLTQVIMNLLSNAMKFTPEGGEISIAASFTGEENEICELQIEVIDNGIGISAEHKDRMFGAFEQADSATNRKFGGTGLGLTITKRIVELMGGEIWVESEPGKGSRFIFTVKMPRGESDIYIAGQDGLTHDTSKKFTGKKILLAEDIEINREILIALLDGLDLMIDCAENGKVALDMVADNPGKYDLVFMDMQMPEMDGLEATQGIRALEDQNAKKIPIVAMTANVFKEDIMKCIDAGMNDHIGKPINFDDVLDKLRTYLN